jgi:CheY-like chemotaxis protein
MFESLMRNLVFNAIKFTPQKGRITIEAKPFSESFVLISIKDTGVGMNKDLLDNLFRLDANTSRPGTEGESCTGLGLIISRDFVEKHGGKIWVESEEGFGSTFSFTIPYDSGTVEKALIKSFVLAKGKIDQTDPQNLGLKILIAEDDEISELLVKIALTDFYKEIITVKTGIDAVETCRNHPEMDLVLMDIRMPGIDGYEATRQIRLFNRDVVIIAQTAFGISGEYEKAIEAGCDDYIAKPLIITVLKEIILKHFK